VTPWQAAKQGFMMVCRAPGTPGSAPHTGWKADVLQASQGRAARPANVTWSCCSASEPGLEISGSTPGAEASLDAGTDTAAMSVDCALASAAASNRSNATAGCPIFMLVDVAGIPCMHDKRLRHSTICTSQRASARRRCRDTPTCQRCLYRCFGPPRAASLTRTSQPDKKFMH
jgi:hypothetical protein